MRSCWDLLAGCNDPNNLRPLQFPYLAAVTKNVLAIRDRYLYGKNGSSEDHCFGPRLVVVRAQESEHADVAQPAWTPRPPARRHVLAQVFLLWSGLATRTLAHFCNCKISYDFLLLQILLHPGHVGMVFNLTMARTTVALARPPLRVSALCCPVQIALRSASRPPRSLPRRDGAAHHEQDDFAERSRALLAARRARSARSLFRSHLHHSTYSTLVRC